MKGNKVPDGLHIAGVYGNGQVPSMIYLGFWLDGALRTSVAFTVAEARIIAGGITNLADTVEAIHAEALPAHIGQAFLDCNSRSRN